MTVKLAEIPGFANFNILNTGIIKPDKESIKSLIDEIVRCLVFDDLNKTEQTTTENRQLKRRRSLNCPSTPW